MQAESCATSTVGSRKDYAKSGGADALNLLADNRSSSLITHHATVCVARRIPRLMLHTLGPLLLIDVHPPVLSYDII
jgi:hypothetical protein